MQLLQLAVLYGWLGRDLVPVAMIVRGTIAGHNCRTDAHFSNYMRMEKAPCRQSVADYCRKIAFSLTTTSAPQAVQILS